MTINRSQKMKTSFLLCLVMMLAAGVKPAQAAQPTLSSIAVTPQFPAIRVGQTQVLTATGTYSDGSTNDLTHAATWMNVNCGGAATVSASGAVTGTAVTPPGGCEIEALLDGIGGLAFLTVGNTPALTTIAVTPRFPSLFVGQTRKLKATATYSDGSTLDVSTAAAWINVNCGAAARVTASGAVTGTALTPAGGCEIEALLAGVGGLAFLSVGNSPALNTIAVTPQFPSLSVGQTQQLHASGTYSDGVTRDLTHAVTWLNVNCGAAATVSASGALTGNSVTLPGGCEIEALLNGAGGLAFLNVSNFPALTTIAVTPQFPSIGVGQIQALKATATYSDGSTRDVTATASWMNVNCGAAASVSASGVVAGTGATLPGGCEIEALLNGAGGIAVLNVSNSPALTNVALTPQFPTLVVGQLGKLRATGIYADGSTRDISGAVTWINVNCGEVATLSPSGALIGTAATLAGVCEIEALLNGVGGFAFLHVNGSPALTTIAVTPQFPSLAIGQVQQLQATGTYSDGSTRDVTGAVTWRNVNCGSSARVSASGALAGTAPTLPGGCEIEALLAGVGGLAFLNVIDSPALTTIAVTPQFPIIIVGQARKLTATAIYADGSTRDVSGAATWVNVNCGTSAMVSASGIVTGTAPTPAGSCEIEAILGGAGGLAFLIVN